MFYAATALLAFVMVEVGVDVVLRYFFNKPIIWSTEINENNLVYITFLCASYLLSKNRHVSVEMVTDRMTPGQRHLFTGLNSIVGFVICAIIAYYGTRVSVTDFFAGTYKPTQLRIPNIYIFWVIPLLSPIPKRVVSTQFAPLFIALIALLLACPKSL